MRIKNKIIKLNIFTNEFTLFNKYICMCLCACVCAAGFPKAEFPHFYDPYKIYKFTKLTNKAFK